MAKITKIKRIPAINFAKFRGKELAIVGGKVVASGKSSKEVFEKAKKMYPKKAAKDIVLFSAPREKVFIYFFKLK